MRSPAEIVTIFLVVALRLAHGAFVLLGLLGGLSAASMWDADSISYEYFVAGAGVAGMPWSMPFSLLPDGGIHKVVKAMGFWVAAAINTWLLYRHRLIRGRPRCRAAKPG